jgi:arylsulfatase A-like enzyme
VETLGDRPTFAEQLSDAGYSTRAFHKCPWLETGDVLRGFVTQTHTNSSSPTRKQQLAAAVNEISPTMQQLLRSLTEFKQSTVDQVSDGIATYRAWRRPPPQRLRMETGGGRTIRQAVSAMDTTDEPFCWFLWLNDAHWKYKPPNPYHRSFTDRSVAELVYNYLYWQYKVYSTPSDRLQAITGAVDPPASEIQTFQNLYRGCLNYCDALLNKLITGLKTTGVWDNTILIIFGDHGDAFGEHGVFGHHFSLEDPLVHVPLLIRDPTGRLEPGGRSDPVSLIDIHPTVLDLADVSGPTSSGTSLLEGARDEVYIHYDVTDLAYYTDAPQRGIDQAALPPSQQFGIWRSPDQKVFYYPDRETYVDVGPDSETLRARLDEHVAEVGEVSAEDGTVSGSVAQRLEDMGYLSSQRDSGTAGSE